MRFFPQREELEIQLVLLTAKASTLKDFTLMFKILPITLRCIPIRNSHVDTLNCFEPTKQDNIPTSETLEHLTSQRRRITFFREL